MFVLMPYPISLFNHTTMKTLRVSVKTTTSTTIISLPNKCPCMVVYFLAFEERYSVMAIENEWDDVRANAISYLPIQPHNDEDPESKCENDYQYYNNIITK